MNLLKWNRKPEVKRLRGYKASGTNKAKCLLSRLDGTHSPDAAAQLQRTKLKKLKVKA